MVRLVPNKKDPEGNGDCPTSHTKRPGQGGFPTSPLKHVIIIYDLSNIPDDIIISYFITNTSISKFFLYFTITICKINLICLIYVLFNIDWLSEANEALLPLAGAISHRLVGLSLPDCPVSSKLCGVHEPSSASHCVHE